jgi:hypothetical protein
MLCDATWCDATRLRVVSRGTKAIGKRYQQWLADSITIKNNKAIEKYHD